LQWATPSLSGYGALSLQLMPRSGAKYKILSGGIYISCGCRQFLHFHLGHSVPAGPESSRHRVARPKVASPNVSTCATMRITQLGSCL
jgi:hypothetical protein